MTSRISQAICAAWLHRDHPRAYSFGPLGREPFRLTTLLTVLRCDSFLVSTHIWDSQDQRTLLPMAWVSCVISFSTCILTSACQDIEWYNRRNPNSLLAKIAWWKGAHVFMTVAYIRFLITALLYMNYEEHIYWAEHYWAERRKQNMPSKLLITKSLVLHVLPVIAKTVWRNEFRVELPPESDLPSDM